MILVLPKVRIAAQPFGLLVLLTISCFFTRSHRRRLELSWRLLDNVALLPSLEPPSSASHSTFTTEERAGPHKPLPKKDLK